MIKRTLKPINYLLIIALVVSMLSGCGVSTVASAYPLESVSENGSQVSRVYRAENQSVPEVVQALSEERKPKEISKTDEEQMFLVYSDEWVNIQKDPEQPSDSLVEVSNIEYVRNNYSPSFLEGYILASILHDVFDSHRGGSYRGYTQKKVYKPSTTYHTPTAKDVTKYPPPVTKQGIGSIIKRGSTVKSSTTTKGSIFKKDSTSNSSVGKITRSSGNTISGSGLGSKIKSSIISRPKSHSPPKIKFGGSGRIMKRR